MERIAMAHGGKCSREPAVIDERPKASTSAVEEAICAKSEKLTYEECPCKVGPDHDLPLGWTKTQQIPGRVTKRRAEEADSSIASFTSSAVSTITPPPFHENVNAGEEGRPTDESAFQQKPLKMVDDSQEGSAGATGTTSVGRSKPHDRLDDDEPRVQVQRNSATPQLPQEAIGTEPAAATVGDNHFEELISDPRQQAVHKKPQALQQSLQDQEHPVQKGLEVAADDLVQATLIRDVDDSSNHSDLVIMPPLTQSISTRGSTTAAITVESDMAVVEAKPVEPLQAKTMSRRMICAVMGLLLLVIAALSVGFVVSAQRQRNLDSSDAGDGIDRNASVNPSIMTPPIPSTTPTATPIPVLQRLEEQGGKLRCGVLPGPGLFYLDKDGKPSGFDAALCAAVAAAATGDPKNLEYIEDSFHTVFENLSLGKVDMVAGGITHTMERQVFESSAKSGFVFSVPYLYQGMKLAGDPTLVDCGDQGLEYIAACGAIRVCVVDRSTHQQMLSSFLPGQKLFPIDNRDDLRKSLADGTCNVIAHEGYNLAESLVREAGYKGPYKVGRTLFSKEPLAALTAPDDPKFSDFVNSVIQSLVVAEANNITQTTSNKFDQTYVFGEEYKDMFRHAVAAGGNYGQLYEEFLEPYSKRQALNLINYGDSTTTGLLYSHPFGSIASEDGHASGTLVDIKRREVLRCGVRPNRIGFAELEFDSATGAVVSLSGIEIDYCRALAGSIFEAKGDLVEFVQIADELDGFAKLAAGDLDVLAGVTWNFPNEVSVPGVNEGFSFTQPYFYSIKGGGEEENLCLATKQDDHLWVSFVYWIAAAIVQAEETNIDQGMSNSMPPIYLFGEEFSLCFQDAILTVGNHKEIYDRNLGNTIPRSGRNLPNGNIGAQMYSMPGLMDPGK